jgi:hypothetical protein
MVNNIQLHEGSEKWIMLFTGNEVQLLILLLAFENERTETIILTVNIRKRLAQLFGKSYRYVQRIMQQLEAKGALLRLSQDDMLVNPMYFYKGGTKNWKTKNERYLQFTKKLENADTNKTT